MSSGPARVIVDVIQLNVDSSHGHVYLEDNEITGSHVYEKDIVLRAVPDAGYFPKIQLRALTSTSDKRFEPTGENEYRVELLHPKDDTFWQVEFQKITTEVTGNIIISRILLRQRNGNLLDVTDKLLNL